MTTTPAADEDAAPDTFELLPGRPVPRMGYGTMQLMREDSDEERETARHLLRRARELGVVHYDTAPFYSKGLVLEALADAFAPWDDDLLVVSKCGLVHDPESGAFQAAQKPAQIREQVEATLRALRTEQVGVVNLRRMDDGRAVAEGDQRVPIEDQLAELAALRDEGKIGGIGLSQVTAGQLRAALPVGIVGVQNAYNVLLRGGEDVLEMCRAEGLAFVPYFPLGSAAPQIPSVSTHPVVEEIAARLGATPAQVGLAWLLRHAPNVLLIPGTRSIGHLEENVAATGVRLPDEDVATLDALGEDTLPAM